MLQAAGRRPYGLVNSSGGAGWGVVPPVRAYPEHKGLSGRLMGIRTAGRHNTRDRGNPGVVWVGRRTVPPSNRKYRHSADRPRVFSIAWGRPAVWLTPTNRRLHAEIGCGWGL